MSDYIDQFRHAIEAAGLPAPDPIIGDSALHRFSTNGKPSDDSGWYVLHTDGIPAGTFGCWRSGIKSSWCAKSANELTVIERQAMRDHMQAMETLRKAEKAKLQAKAKGDAAALLAKSVPALNHAYLAKKRVQASGARIEGDWLIIPMRDTAGVLHSLQKIAPDGSKRFQYGGRVRGCYFSIGKPAGRLIICEGFATGASIHECTGHAVAVAFNAGNLESVALALREKYPALAITIAADDDHKTEGNPGLTKATAAAQAVGGSLAEPMFATGRPDKATDFNDLHILTGADAVRQCIDAAGTPMTSWPVPIPLPNALPPVQAFDPDLLPEALRGWVIDISHRMQCPADFPAVAALVGLSSLIGARAVIQPKAKDTWQVVPNLWGAVIGRPGVKKSPALSEAMKPLNRLQANEFELWEAAHDAWALDAKVAEMAGDQNEKRAKGLSAKDPAAARALLEPIDTPEEPIARRFIVNDATVEKLGELMQQNEWGILSYRDELYGLLTGLDKQGQEGSRAFYLQSYDGNQGYTFDRIGRGTVHIPRVCLAMIGGIQPGRIHEYVRGAMAGGGADDGLLQRFGLAVWPDIAGDFIHIDQWPDTSAKQTAYAVFDRLAELQPANDTDPVVWQFTSEAQAIFVEWLVPFEMEIRGDDLHPAMVSHLSKYRKLIPALALVFALIDTPDSDGMVGENELIRALAWGDYLRTHANRLYAAAVVPETSGAATLLSKISGGKMSDRDGVILADFAPREVAVKNWAGLNTVDAVRKAADMLADYDWLRRDVVQSADVMGRGRPSDRYTVNPALFKQGVP